MQYNKIIVVSYTASFPVRDGRYGLGTGPMIQNSYMCDGTEQWFFNCTTRSSVTCTNGHTQDAAVRCGGEHSLRPCQLGYKYIVSIM